MSESRSEPSVTRRLPPDLEAAVSAAAADWRREGKTRRLWDRDASLWTGGDEARWLDWLGIASRERGRVTELKEFAEEVRRAGFPDALLLGMGGSSLAPEVLRQTFGRTPGFPELHVLDSTDPGQVLAFDRRVDPARTIYIVSSKSGTTLEPNILKQYFFARVAGTIGEGEAGSRFVTVTDPGSRMQQVAEADRFRRIFFGQPAIGGRYSALSRFGLVPAAILGLDVERLLERAQAMADRCAEEDPEANPGVLLGLILGVLAGRGRDKVTLVASAGIRDLGAWLEQLLAESTGKQGRALIPVDRESAGAPGTYGDDRIFVYLKLDSEPDPAQSAAVAALERAGQPVLRIRLADPYDLAGEFFRWEVATAVAGAVIGIHPFDQPDVEASKIETRKLTEAFERTGSLPAEKPILEEKGIRLFADERNATALTRSAGKGADFAAMIRAHLDRLGPGDYFGLLAYLSMNETHEAPLQAMRHAVRDSRRAATCLGFGPRFLHSTGQAYKGGPNSGVFLQITADDAEDLPVPGQRYTFGLVKAAQAAGDLRVLAERNRRILRVHLGPDTREGLDRLGEAIRQARA